MTVKYEVDPFNNLIVQGGGESGVPEFRHVLDGAFKMGEDNSLTYHVKASASPDAEKIGLPHQIKFKGAWSINKNHELRLTLDKVQRAGDSLTLSGEIVGAQSGSLLFAVRTTAARAGTSVKTLKLQGSWRADENNRLKFMVSKSEGPHDTLTFDGIWEVNRNKTLIYRYTKQRRDSGEEVSNGLVFKGFWDITDKDRVAYVLDYKKDSYFSFTTRMIEFHGRWIKYEIGLNVSFKDRPVKKSLTLFGRWKIRKNIGLVFEYETEERKYKSIAFAAEVSPSGEDTILFKIKNKAGEDAGIEFKLSRKFLEGSGEAFLRLLKSSRESAVYIGAGWTW